METVSSVFRKHHELEPTGKLTLLGEPCCIAERMDAYVKRRNPQAPEMAELYLRLGKRYGIRGDVAYCQMVVDTRCWTIDIMGPLWGPIMLTEGGEEIAIDVQMQLLYTFASREVLKQVADVAKRPIAWIERSGWRGRTPCWEDLNGRWSHSGNLSYGQDIVAIWRNMQEWQGAGKLIIR